MVDEMTEAVERVKARADAVLVAQVLTDGADWGDLTGRAREVEAAASEVVRAVVLRARSQGATWQVIGDALGVTRQAAFQRYGKPVDPSTGGVMERAPLAGAAESAREVVEALAAGRWPTVVEQFDTAMRDALPEHALVIAWTHIAGLAGALESVGDATTVRAGDVTIVDVSLAFEAADYTARVSFRDDRAIAGLHILATGQGS